MVLGYSSSIYSTDHPTSFDVSLDAVSPWVTQEMNCELMRAFKEEEIRLALN